MVVVKIYPCYRYVELVRVLNRSILFLASKLLFLSNCHKFPSPFQKPLPWLNKQIEEESWPLHGVHHNISHRVSVTFQCSIQDTKNHQPKPSWKMEFQRDQTECYSPLLLLHSLLECSWIELMTNCQTLQDAWSTWTAGLGTMKQDQEE